MKRLLALLIGLHIWHAAKSQELNANVQVNYSQIQGSNVQTYKTLEKNLRDFINNTSWTGKKLQNFEKIKCSFAIIISQKDGNDYKGSIVVQSVRPVFGSTYESPLLNLNDTSFGFNYVENENLTFNERQFSGQNLTDVVSFYVYMILGYDADSFRARSGQPYFEKARQIVNNSANRNYAGWAVSEGLRTRAGLVNALLAEDNNQLRNISYSYHRAGLDNMSNEDPSTGKRALAAALLQLKEYENNFQMNYPFSVFIEAKKDEIYNIFSSRDNAGIDLTELKALMSTIDPKDTDSKWAMWK